MTFTTLKIMAVIAVLGAFYVAGWHEGGMASKTALEGFQAAQSANTAKAVLAERASAAAELARVNSILKGYQDAPIDPVSVGLASRLYASACPASGPVPGANPDPSGARPATPEPRGDPRLVGLTQALIDACARDAEQLSALQAAWPR